MCNSGIYWCSIVLEYFMSVLEHADRKKFLASHNTGIFHFLGPNASSFPIQFCSKPKQLINILVQTILPNMTFVVRGYHFLRKGESQIFPKLASIKLRPSHFGNKIFMTPITDTPYPLKQAKILLKSVFFEQNKHTLSVVILWLPTFWFLIILWPPIFLSKHLWLPQYIWDPSFQRKW